jgi:hypothetical protein
MSLRFPTYDNHDDVKCFKCEAVLVTANWTRGQSAPGSGQYRKKCPSCGMATWYDLLDTRDKVS